MGALGAAMLSTGARRTRFKGFSLASQELFTTSFYCSDCPNSCGVIEVSTGSEIIARWGDTCGKWGEAVS